MTITIASLRAAGLSAEQIVAVLEVEERQRVERRREQNRVNQANSRARRQQVSADSGDRDDIADSAAPSKVPPITPLNTPQGSEPIGSAPGGAPAEQVDVVGEDPKARLFRVGKTILVSFGIAEKRTGSLLGQWLKSKNDPAGLLAAIQFARDQNVAEPVAYVSTLVNGKGKPNGHGKQDLGELALELADQLRERERAAGIGRPPAA